MPTAVIADQLSKQYQPPAGWWRRSATPPVQAVWDVSLTTQTGELFGLLGPNGAGKTTLVKMLCTLIRPSSGTAVVAGHPLTQAGAIRAAVGLVVSDERSFYWRLSARRNLDFFAALYGLKGQPARDQVQAVLTAVDLAAVAERPFRHFSSGMRQRLAIARALLHRPRLLFLDEPSRSLDPAATQKLHDLILRLRREQEMTIFLITHDLVEAEKLCDRVAVMHEGRIRTIGRPENLRRELHPRRRYLIHLRHLDTAVSQALQQRFPHLHIEDNQLSFQAEEGDGVLTAVLSALHEHQLTIDTVDSSLPTLEDVFTHYTRTLPLA